MREARGKRIMRSAPLIALVLLIRAALAMVASTVEELPALEVKSAKELGKACTSETP